MLRIKAVLVDRVDPVQQDRSQATCVESRRLICAIKHDFEEVLAVVSKVHLLKEDHEQRWISSVEGELAVAEREYCLQARSDVTELCV